MWKKEKKSFRDFLDSLEVEEQWTWRLTTNTTPKSMKNSKFYTFQNQRKKELKLTTEKKSWEKKNIQKIQVEVIESMPMFCSRSPMPRCVCFIRKFHIVAVSRLLLPPHIRHHVLSPSKRTEENSKNRKIFDSSRRKHLIKVGLMLSHKMSNQELNGVFFFGDRWALAWENLLPICFDYVECVWRQRKTVCDTNLINNLSCVFSWGNWKLFEALMHSSAYDGHTRAQHSLCLR